MQRLSVKGAKKGIGVAWPLSEDAQPQGVKGNVAQLTSRAPTQMWVKEEME